MNDVKKPTVSLSRDNYNFVLSFGHLDGRLTNTNESHGGRKYINGKICIEREIHIKGSSNVSKKTVEIGPNNSSWTYKLDKNSYYPFIGQDNRESNLNKRISKIVFRVWVKFDERYLFTSPGGTQSYSYKTKKSEKVVKTYKFEAAVKPTAAIGYSEDGTYLSYAIDLNDSHMIDSNSKKVTTRCWAWLTRDILGDSKKAVKVSGHTGKWYDRESNSRIVSSINIKNDISGIGKNDAPVKYTLHAYCAGPGGKSETITKSHVFAKPLSPASPKIVKKNTGFYKVSWTLNKSNGWRPVDSVTIEYCDSANFILDNYGDGTWSTAKENINSGIASIMTNDIGKIANNCARYFRLKVEHDGNVNYSKVSTIVGYGKLDGISPKVSDVKINDKTVVKMSWDNVPSCTLYNTSDAYKNKSVRIEIYEIATNNLIHTVKQTDTEWTSKEWVYDKYNSKTNPNKKFGFRVIVGDNSVKGFSNIEWVNGLTLPVIENVKASKWNDSNTICKVTWSNPVKTDTIYNGIQIAWSEYLDIWKMNSDPSTATFDNINMNEVYITGLSAGNIYYFWARNYRIDGEQTYYSEWSDPSEGVLMSDDPDDPVLTLSRSWIKKGGSALAAQWVYNASANCPQTEAQIEYSTNEEWTNSKIIAKVNGEEDHCDIDTSVLFPYEKGSSSIWEWDHGSYIITKYSNIMLYIDKNWVYKKETLNVRWYYTDGTAYGKSQKPSDVQNYTQLSASLCITNDNIYADNVKSEWVNIRQVNDGSQEMSIVVDNIEYGHYFIKLVSTHLINGSKVSLESNPIPFDVVNKCLLRVLVSNNHGSALSDTTELLLANKPFCTLQSKYSDTYKENSQSLVRTTNENGSPINVLMDSSFKVYVSGNGDLCLYIYVLDTFECEHPDKTKILYENDCIWSTSVKGDEYVIDDVPFIDNCRYRIQLECTDPDTLLKADPQYIDFEVHWKHQAIAPSDSKVVMGYVLNQNGDFVLNAEGDKIEDPGVAYLIPVKPEGASDDDVCDIYRTTSDGRFLCRENVAWGQVVRDQLPSFGEMFEHSYCFCTKTKDGDEAWADIPYELNGTGAIINYGDDFVALPWNVTIDDKRSKQGETRYHLGGTKAYYSQPYIERSQSISAEIVKNENEDLVEQLYELSRFTDVCYIRTSNNIGYPATVDVSINRAYNNQILSVSLDIKETEIDGEYMGSIIND